METERDEAGAWLVSLEDGKKEAVGLLGRAADGQDVEGNGEVALPRGQMPRDMVMEI